MSHDESVEVGYRLRAILSQLQVMIRMVENERPCIQILHQLGITQQRLHALKCTLVLHQVQKSMNTLQSGLDEESLGQELMRLVELYGEKLYTRFVAIRGDP